MVIKIRKKINILMMGFFGLGQLTRALTNFLGENLSDFAQGFLDGISIVFVISGFIYICKCLIQRKNPFRFNE
jgi:hypothetical protein